MDIEKESSLDDSASTEAVQTTPLSQCTSLSAEQRLASFEASRKHYYQVKSQLFGPALPSDGGKASLTHTTKLKEMVRRIFEVTSDLVESCDEAGTLKQASVAISVLPRDALLTDSMVEPLLKIEANKELLRNFMEQELYKEVNCERFLMIKGLTPPQFRLLIRKMGYNPWAFLSDPRGENAGRVAIDNQLLENSKHPLVNIAPTEPDYNKEMALWQPVFPKLAHIPWIKDWHMSRTHGVVYGLKDEEGKDVLMFPVHVDPKNPVVIIRDIFERKKDERGALAYHQISKDEDMGQEKYIGTGLYDLGCKNFIRLLREAQAKGLCARLIVDGEEQLKTTNTIVGDDRATWQIAEEVQ